MTEATANVKPRRRIPVIWLVPIVAAVLGIWVVVYNLMTQGPTISVTFSTAEGIQAGKTKIKARDVELGVVDTVELTKDLEHVVVTAQLERFALPLLREDSQFWVVRPRVGPGGVSGLGTILSGGYIKLDAGTGKTGRRKFVGLDNPPVTPVGSPGLQLYLTSTQAGSVSAGDPVLFRGYRVGAIETASFDTKSQEVRYSLFIDEPYDALVSQNTRFWNASGITLKAGAEGVELELGSLQTLLIGGVSFDLPKDTLAGMPAKDGDVYELLPNFDAVNRKSYRNYIEYVVSFTQSVRGLNPGAPVEYRGLNVGTVERVMLDAITENALQGRGDPIPVLIRIEPGRVGLPDTAAAVAGMERAVREGVEHGMRATLKTANLLTGSSMIAIDYFPDQEPAELGEFGGYPEIPTLSGGIARIEQQVNQLLAKINSLPLEPAVRNLDATLAKLRDTLESVNEVIASPATQEIPASLNETLRSLNAAIETFSPDSQNAERLSRTLAELNQNLRNLEAFTRTLSQKPNSIIFAPPVTEDPVPQRKQQ